MANTPGKIHPSAGLVFLICLAVYAAITPYVASQAWPTGDEPHYLVLAHSLIHDHDFDVGNNYRSKYYGTNYPSDVDPPDQHTITNSRGEQLLWHDVGI